MGVAMQNRFDGWIDWRVDLLAAASYLTVSPDLRRKWEQIGVKSPSLGARQPRLEIHI